MWWSGGVSYPYPAASRQPNAKVDLQSIIGFPSPNGERHIIIGSYITPDRGRLARVQPYPGSNINVNRDPNAAFFGDGCG